MTVKEDELTTATQQQQQYLDWNDSLGVLNDACKAGLFVLIIGPKGTGKTSLVREFVNKQSLSTDNKMYSINFSLRTRESHLIGTNTLSDGTVTFDEGLLVRSMKEGGILYLDEINVAEADVLIRLDEALDERRQIVLKESSGETIHANKEWFVVASINPLTHSGTKELPPQLLSRFPVRIRLEYPPEETEVEIARRNVPKLYREDIIPAIRLANVLRQAAAVEDLFYAPSLRETIAFGKLVVGGMRAKAAASYVFGNVYAQWGDIEYQKVSDIITSMFDE